MDIHFPQRGCTPLPEGLKGNRQAVILLQQARKRLAERDEVYICNTVCRLAAHEDMRVADDLTGLIADRLRHAPGNYDTDTLGIWLAGQEFIESPLSACLYQRACRVAWIDDLIEEITA
jgi:hypothetical protein